MRARRLLVRESVEDPTASKPTETAAPTKRSGAAGYPWPRLANMLLGMWLQISAFAWPHSDGGRISSWVMGLLISIVAVLSLGAPPMRWLNGVLALWLILWTAATATGDALGYGNAVAVGLLVLVLSTIGSRSLDSDFRD